MADWILSPIAQIIIDRLGSEAVRQISSLWGVNDELDQLRQTISTIQAVLLDAEKKQRHNNQVQNWLQRLSGVVDDADNLMDEINTQALRCQVMSGNQISKQMCTFFSSSNQFGFRFKIGRRIEDIKKKLEAISNDRNFLLETGREEALSVKRVRDNTHSYVRQEDVIGRDMDRLAIKSKLLSESGEDNVSLIAVVGIGGLGKTMLAKSVFNDEQVQKHFELKMWVCVSDDFDLKQIVAKIIKAAPNDKNLENLEMEQLQKRLREVLGGKRYFLVLDDVWEENRAKWLQLEELITDGAKGSRVLVTTRSKRIADFTASKDQSHALGILNEDQSWTLFKRVAFKSGQEPENSNLVKIGREIVGRCKGVPLAIRTIGNLLYGENLESKWLALNKEFSEIPQASEEDIMPTLRLSYDHLASHLKLCFAYCCLFPKDYEIEVETLVRLWVAQGFLKLSNTSQDQCLEKVGYEYFMNLTEGSFFQDVEVDQCGVITQCKMHDLMHDLAILVSGEKCATFHSNCQGNINENTHHVSFERDSFSVSQTLLVQARKVRTVLFLDEYCSKVELDAVVSNFLFIRSLNLKELKTNSLNSIGRLKHLRYLDLSHHQHLEALPNSITNLVNLQTLKLSNCKKFRELPRDIENLINLRHLEIDNCRKLEYMPSGIGQLTNLQTLSMYVLKENKKPVLRYVGELKDLLRLNGLRGKLDVVNLRHKKDEVEEYGSAKLKDKQYLRSLRLDWYYDVEIVEADAIIGYEMSMDALQPHPNLQVLDIRNYGGVKLSSWLSSLENLVDLNLVDCKKCQYLVSLNRFHDLKVLKLWRLESLEYISNNIFNEDLFGTTKTILPSLRELELNKLPNLKGWWREIVIDHSFVAANEEDKHMSLPYLPSLSTLEIWDCPKLTCMPLYPHLEKLYLSNTSLNPLEETLRMKMMSSSTGSIVVFPTTTSSFSPLSTLKDLTLSAIEDLECLPDWFESLTSSLNYLCIESCPKLKDLCPGILHLSSLRHLEISNCEGLADMLNGDDGIMWKALTGRLHSLNIVTVLPKGIQHLTSLQQLVVSSSDSLTTIPKWIHNLKSLKTLHLQDCPNLTSFPEGIRSLTTLNSLFIWDCPMLLKRCKREIGEDWDKISHIQHLDLYPNPNKEENENASEIKGCNPFKKFGL
ncbi:putative disease resistance protein RGA1 [Humulus lupulus]|uniref:putative disease resistance protein RGA1 n=1 Tax=Humulus lupulus TaxID=3486 RepID=UPI002B405874|nr:putative disease resistance protein RGA1 [Humulus lupulus]XP_062117908.1 putative disease resistance protein RGA1 [Humulus lupulus]